LSESVWAHVQHHHVRLLCCHATIDLSRNPWLKPSTRQPVRASWDPSVGYVRGVVNGIDPPRWGSGLRQVDGGAQPLVWEIGTPGAVRVVKVGDAVRLAHEARTLAELGGTGLCPALVAVGDGVLVTDRLAGDPRPPETWALDDARALGALVARTHETRTTPWRGLPEDAARQVSAADYLSARIDHVQSRRTSDIGELIDRALAHAPIPGSGDAVRLHGDLWSGNVVWCSEGPRLVDWEYSRQGERAEELAYLAAMDDLTKPVLDAVFDGYGADRELRQSVGLWRPLMAIWSGLWFGDHGDLDRRAQLFACAGTQMT
jgi:aminoglycoside phosphotransferase (APT) family kinase protein